MTPKRGINQTIDYQKRDTRGRRKEGNRGSARTPDEVLADEIGKFFYDPLGYVMFNFPWATEQSIRIIPLAEGVEELLTKADQARQKKYRDRFPNCEYGPDLWACDFLDEVGKEAARRKFDGRTPVEPLRFATVSGHEIGKSVLVAWLVKWIMDTRPHSVISVTAVTDEQLRTKTWGELGKWNQMSLTEHWFDYSSSRGNMSLVHKHHPKWRADARTARKERSESFAGQHAPMATSAYFFDEASGIEPKIFEVREGGLTSGEPMIFDFGNGTQPGGPFFDECEGTLKGRYIVRSIDSRTVAITNKAKIAQDAEDRGEDSDFFRVRWRGLFPEKGFTQFIGTALVDAAMERDDLNDMVSALVMGVDVARFGDDDSVIWARRGLDARSFDPVALTGFDTTELLDAITGQFNFFRNLGTPPRMIFVDAGNTGGAIVDFLRKLGYPVTGIMFGSNPIKKDTYRYKGDELWGNLRDALKAGLVLPRRDSKHGERIHAELTQRMYGFLKGTERMWLEPKPDAKARGIPSPDFGDSLGTTYAFDVADVPGDFPQQGGKVEHEYDPFEDI